MPEAILCAGQFYCRSCSKHLRLRFTPGLLSFPEGPIGPLPRCSCGGEVLPLDDDAHALREKMNDNGLVLDAIERHNDESDEEPPGYYP